MIFFSASTKQKNVKLVYFHQTKNMIFGFCFYQTKNVKLVYFHQTKKIRFFSASTKQKI